MKFKLALALVALVPFITICPDANAQGLQYSAGDQGVVGRTSRNTAMMTRSQGEITRRQRPSGGLRRAGLGGLTRITGGPRGINGLPETRLDSFVRNTPNPFMVYGDEGVTLPPINEFTPVSRIQNRMTGNPGLSTGHGSSLGRSWGGTAGPRHAVDWEGDVQSGPNGGQIQNWRRSVTQFGLDRLDLGASRGRNGSNGNGAQTFAAPSNATPNGVGGGGFGFSFP